MVRHFTKKQINRFSFAFSGIWHALRKDFSFRWQFLAGGLATATIIYFFSPTHQELFFLLLGWVLIMITELQNTSFEAALDRLHPELHEQIGRSKDMAAGAVLLAGFFYLGVTISIIAF